MKKTVFSLLSLCVLSFNLSAAERIVITGRPLTLEKQGEYYVVPETWTNSSYVYTNISGTDRVCYAERQPQLVGIDVLPVGLVVKGEKKSWHCYTADPKFYTIQP